MPDRVRVHIDGRELELSNLDKVLYPAAGFTKGEVIEWVIQDKNTLTLKRVEAAKAAAPESRKKKR